MRNIKLNFLTNKEKQEIFIDKNNQMTKMNSMLGNDINKNRVKKEQNTIEKQG